MAYVRDESLAYKQPPLPLRGEHALVAALLNLVLANRTHPNPFLRGDAERFFASGAHQWWLHLVGLDETCVEQALRKEVRC